MYFVFSKYEKVGKRKEKDERRPREKGEIDYLWGRATGIIGTTGT